MIKLNFFSATPIDRGGVGGGGAEGWRNQNPHHYSAVLEV